MTELLHDVILNCNPSRQLTQVSRLITRHFDRQLAPLGMNVAYLPVLGALRNSEQLSQKELIEIGQIGQPAMAQMLDRMVKDDILVRTPATDDKRKSLFALSEKTRARMPEVGTILKAENEKIFAPLGAEGMQSLMSLLGQLEQSLKAG